MAKSGNEGATTIGLVVAAAVLAAGAYMTQPRRQVLSAEAAEIGKPFFPDLTLDKIKGLDVTDYDKKKSETNTFRVENSKGVWSLPLYNNYPADARDALAKATAWLTSVKRDVKLTTDKKQFKEFGVLNPTDEKGSDGVGTLVKVLDESKNVLAAVIVGNEVEGKTGWRYLREPQSDDVYRANVGEYSMSTRFRDWIEKDLLELSDTIRTASNATEKEREKFKKTVAQVTWTDYTLKEPVVPAEVKSKKSEVLKFDGGNEWSPQAQLNGVDPIKEETNPDKVRDLNDALRNLQIVQVLPKPPGLGPDLRATRPVVTQEDRQKLVELMNSGFLATRDQDVVPVDGELVLETKEGITYKLRFGVEAVVAEDGKVMSNKADGAKKDDGKKDDKKADAKSDPKKSDPKKSEEKKDGDKKEGEETARFVLVAASFDEKKFPPVVDPPEPKLDPTKPGDKAAEEAAKKKLEAEKQFVKMQTDEKRKQRDEAIANGKVRAKELSDRYDRWYYLISNDNYKKLKIERSAFVRAKEKKDGEKKDGADAGKAPLPGVLGGDSKDMTNPNLPAPKEPAKEPTKDEKKPDAGKAPPPPPTKTETKAPAEKGKASK